MTGETPFRQHLRRIFWSSKPLSIVTVEHAGIFGRIGIQAFVSFRPPAAKSKSTVSPASSQKAVILVHLYLPAFEIKRPPFCDSHGGIQVVKGISNLGTSGLGKQLAEKTRFVPDQKPFVDCTFGWVAFR
jgi:hypothetical protein